MELERLLLKRKEAITLLGVSPMYFDKLNIPCVMIGCNKRYYKKSLIEWIEKQVITTPAPAPATNE